MRSCASRHGARTVSWPGVLSLVSRPGFPRPQCCGSPPTAGADRSTITRYIVCHNTIDIYSPDGTTGCYSASTGTATHPCRRDHRATAPETRHEPRRLKNASNGGHQSSQSPHAVEPGIVSGVWLPEACLIPLPAARTTWYSPPRVGNSRGLPLIRVRLHILCLRVQRPRPLARFDAINSFTHRPAVSTRQLSKPASMTMHSHFLAALTPGDRQALEARLLDSQSGRCFICDRAIDPAHHEQLGG